MEIKNIKNIKTPANDFFSRKIVFTLETYSNQDLYPFFKDFFIPELWESVYTNRESEIKKRKISFDNSSAIKSDASWNDKYLKNIKGSISFIYRDRYVDDMNKVMLPLEFFLEKNLKQLQKCQLDIPETSYLIESYIGLRGSANTSGLFYLSQELMSMLSKLKTECYFDVGDNLF